MRNPDTVEDFENGLRNAKRDTDDVLAKVTGVEIVRRDRVEAAPAGEDSDTGLKVSLQRASGISMVRWFECPPTWEPQHDLVALLRYLGYDPDNEAHDLDNILGLHLPVYYDHTDGGWTLDWQTIGQADLPERRFR